MLLEDDDQLFARSYGIKYTQRDLTSKRVLSMRLAMELFLAVGFITSLSCAIGLGVRLHIDNKFKGQTLSPECVHAVGGGPVASGGGFSSAAPKQFGYCAQQLAEYADLQQGAYWREVELAVSDAMQIFGFVEASTHDNLAGHRNLRELDLGQSALLFGSWQSITKKDATSGYRAHQPLSRHLLQLYGGVPLQQIQQAFQHQQQVQPEQLEPLKQLGGPVAGPAVTSQSRTDRQQVVQPITPDRSKVVIFDIDETVLSNMQQILSPEKWPWDKWVAAAQAPALDPVQQFYRALCAAGYSVAFVTGRREAQRDHTTRNLATAGYGTLCTEAAGSADSDSSGAHGNAECCYTALYMRPQNDTRLASVYKPWARQKLLSAHKMQLLALVGDQFSDLNGGTSAPFAFKLPNPFYYIL